MVLHLTDDFKANAAEWEAAGTKLPQYDPKAVAEYTAEHPYWVHFGAGNLFREVQALIAQDLLNQGEVKAGVIVAETFDADIITDAYKPYDNRGLSVILKSDGSVETELVASVAESFGVKAHDEVWDGLVKVFTNPELQFVTVTITEKGYAIRNNDGELLPWIAPEVENGPDSAVSAMGAITALLLERYKAGQLPIAMVSTDNFSQNGDRFRSVIVDFAKLWADKGFVPEDFVTYVEDPAKVAFPLTMIDRITPNPADSVSKLLEEKGFADNKIFHTAKGTNVAPFANAEETWYLVIEDTFPNGRPALEKAGVFLGDRDTVNKADEMKVTTCLNPVHTALAVTGRLMSYDSMSETIGDKDLKALAERLAYVEGLPVVADPGIFSPKEFAEKVIDVRVPNPSLPDSPVRISTDTSQKVPIRFGVTIKKYVESPDHDVNTLVAIPLAIAAWLRLLLGTDGKATDDNGNEITLSPDPRIPELQSALASLKVGGDLSKADEVLKPILADATLWGTDLTQTPLAEKIVGYFKEFAAGTGTLHPVLEKELGL
ncbi:mannitol dehydrogenase [Bifidobacterium margollesii]|uniref:Mannitol dehydrogenase n=1 Tax=Bifidobacterium margollesii TaxID=2020964 RepID=A0A2N5JCQ7_9BIFI|nr:mannitol dehydrogenase family protein [Bifidobacterium margollesii]PLS32003.1 mannitol dehydrogenase [Bifidobacterium margollesii]